ncbi:porin [Alcaligenaceae bacterium CGII-47]|nr:porin [Alcaligenaceae bacterium CGII-47]
MKKTLLAAALIVGFAGVAQAETSVTLYGILDTGYGYQHYKYDNNNVNIKATSSGLRDGTVNGSRWGMRGSEDLGDGLRAIFTLEAGINLGTGTSASSKMFHRSAFIGLASDSWGTFTMGRQYSPSVTTNVANAGVNMADMDKAFGGVGYGNRMDNSFKYTTPNFSGFEAAVAYGSANTTVLRGQNDTVSGWKIDSTGAIVPATTRTDTDRANWVSAGLKYANGPIGVGLSYDRSNNSYESAITNWAVTGAYDFEVVKLSLAYGQDRNGKLGWGNLDGISDSLGGYMSSATHDFKSHNYYVGLSAPLASGRLSASWSRSSSNLDDASALGDRAKNQNIYGVNYVYPLSKRTSVYAYGSYGTGIGYLDGLKGQEAGVGLNVKF